MISFRSEEHSGRRLRTLTIEKLRGTEIRQHRYIYTLKDGRILAFTNRLPAAPARMGPWIPVPDRSDGSASWGYEALDQVLGGLRGAAIVALEVDPDVPRVYVDAIKAGIICNFAALGRGVAYVPAQKSSAELVREWLGPYLTGADFDGRVRVFESSPLGTFDGGKNALHMEGSNVDTDLKWSNVEYRLPGTKHPFLSFVAFDTLESVYGDDVFDEMTGHLSAVRRGKDCFIGHVSPTTKSTPRLANLAHIHVRVHNLNGSILLYGQKPYTELYNLSLAYRNGVPRIVLTPIV